MLVDVCTNVTLHLARCLYSSFNNPKHIWIIVYRHRATNPCLHHQSITKEQMLTVGKAKGCSPDFSYSLELLPQLIQYRMSLKTVINVIQIHPCSSLQITRVDMNCRSRGLNASDCSVLKGKGAQSHLGSHYRAQSQLETDLEWAPWDITRILKVIFSLVQKR